jgi:tRNA nucleotidyltransferase (CCA-adding enzyme)
VQVSLIKLVAERAYENKFALYIVGGFVRDLLLETPSVDFDLVVEGDAIRLAKQLSHQFGGRVISHHRFGTAKWRIYKQNEVLLKELDQHNLGHIIEVNHLPDIRLCDCQG